MDSNIKVSVFCAVYNHGKYVRDALEGFVSQKTNFGFEVLIHDDASTDQSADIIREYAGKYPDIIKPIYQTENQHSKGVKIYWEYFVPNSRGRYIAMCEGDDYWTDPLKLQKQFDIMESNPDYSLCVCSTEWLNQQTGIKEKRRKVAEDTDISLEEIILGKTKGLFQFASVFIRRDIYEQTPDWKSKFPIGDYPLFIHAALSGKVRLLSDVMCVYRYFADNSWTVRMDNDKSRERISIRMIDGLNALNEATAYQYNDVITERKTRHEYTLALMRHDYDALKTGRLKDVYRSRPLFYRLSDMIRCKHPDMYSKFMKPLAKVIKSKRGE